MNPNVIVMKKGRIPFFSERKTTRENFRLTFTKTYILALVMIGFLGVYYVWTLNINATKGYKIRSLEIEQRNMIFERNLLNMKIAEAQSLSNVTGDKSTLVMVEAENPKFLILKDSSLTFMQPGSKE